MVHNHSSAVTSSNPERLKPPTELATLNIRSSPVSITVSAQGAATKTLTLGVIGPVGTIAVGHYAELPVWAIVAICALQIVGAVTHRWT
jgi:hypothetical protein